MTQQIFSVSLTSKIINPDVSIETKSFPSNFSLQCEPTQFLMLKPFMAVPGCLPALWYKAFSKKMQRLVFQLLNLKCYLPLLHTELKSWKKIFYELVVMPQLTDFTYCYARPVHALDPNPNLEFWIPTEQKAAHGYWEPGLLPAPSVSPMPEHGDICCSIPGPTGPAARQPS